MSVGDWVVDAGTAASKRDPELLSEALFDFRNGIRDRLSPIISTLPKQAITIDIQGEPLYLPQRSRTEVKHVRSVRRETDHVAYLREHVDSTDVVWDVGANVGVYSAALAPHCESCIAFEPAGANQSAIPRTLALNSVEAESDIIGAALANRTGLMEFKLDPRGATPGAGHGRLADCGSNRQASGRTMVQGVQGDELVRDGTVPAPDVLKVDVEGAEMAVLKGLERTFREMPPHLVQVETHSEERHEQVIDELRSRSYDISVAESGPNGMVHAISVK